jgi:hypothetical protein
MNSDSSTTERMLIAFKGPGSNMAPERSFAVSFGSKDNSINRREAAIQPSLLPMYQPENLSTRGLGYPVPHCRRHAIIAAM